MGMADSVRDASDKEWTRRRFVQLATASFATALSGCGGGGGGGATPPPAAPPVAVVPTRRWKLGFSPNPPRPTATAVLQNIDRWSMRAELAIIHEEMPWTKLLSGMSADAILDADKVALVNYMRGKGMQLIYMGELNDGLSRAEEAPQLRKLGRSLTEPAVQQVYRNYMLAVVRKLNPQFIGLAAETNLIRAAAPASLYAAVVKTANDCAADIRAAGGAMPLMVSVQVETAWGVLGSQGPFVGIAQDRRDFPFIDMLGLSSYPYLGYPDPTQIPNDYYSRIVPAGMPAMVMEGGWISANAGTILSSPDKQARYITRQAELLETIDARAWLHLNFADPDLSTFPQPLPASLPLFATIGFTDSDFNSKPALEIWDGLYARRLV
jgi:hypothetical protein